jgi:hypothetical protein
MLGYHGNSKMPFGYEKCMKKTNIDVISGSTVYQDIYIGGYNVTL